MITLQIFIYFLIKASGKIFTISYNIRVNMNTTTRNTIVREFNNRTIGKKPAAKRLAAALASAERQINLSRFSVVGFNSQYSQVYLKPRFYNVRDSKGRFAKPSKSRR